MKTIKKIAVCFLLLALIHTPVKLGAENAIKITPDDVSEEIRQGEMELIAQLVQAEAGNQGLSGMRLVVDVVLNRVESDKFPNTVEDVIFQKNAFSVIDDGAFDKAA